MARSILIPAHTPLEGGVLDLPYSHKRISSDALHHFVDTSLRLGRAHARDELVWRHTDDAYVVWLSEVMLQQTQVARVSSFWPGFISRFPSVWVLADADRSELLDAWQGMGYNRRAIHLHECAKTICDIYEGVFPRDEAALLALPGVGPSTASGICAFAFNMPSVYIETNVRSVVIHELFADSLEPIHDKDIEAILRACIPLHDARGFYYALLDYGAYLKSIMPNPSRKSKSYARQSQFSGSRRQKRSFIVKYVLAHAPVSIDEIAEALNQFEVSERRERLTYAQVEELVHELCSEGFFLLDADQCLRRS